MTGLLQRPGRIGAERQESAPAMPERPPGPFPRNKPRRRRSLSGLAGGSSGVPRRRYAAWPRSGS